VDENAKSPAASDRNGRLDAQLSLNNLLTNGLRAVLCGVSQGTCDAAIIIVSEFGAYADEAG